MVRQGTKGRRSGGGVREFIVFIREAVRSGTICAVVPSTLVVVKRVCKEIPRDRPVTIVEYGPGTGVFTRYLANELHPDSTILAIELHEPFHRELCQWLAGTKTRARVILEHGSCTEVLTLLKKHGLESADFAVSGIPFSVFSESLRSEILQTTHEAIKPGGTFLVYQYSFFMAPRLAKVFERIDRDLSIINLPPTMIMRARKARER